ncbi:hypothetical protein Tco_0043098 [Tanacetum coccineum]
MTSVPNSTELELTALQSGRIRSALVKDPEPPSVPPILMVKHCSIMLTVMCLTPIMLLKPIQKHLTPTLYKDRPVSTRKQLETDAMWCFFNEFLTHVVPKVTMIGRRDIIKAFKDSNRYEHVRLKISVWQSLSERRSQSNSKK